MNKIKLFCLPYAGGSASIYNKWKKYLSNDVDLIPIELAGRGARFNEAPYTRIEDTVTDIYNNIKTKINNEKYMILGHSMGALITYELLHKIISEGGNKPIHVFLSGKMPPHIKTINNNYYKQPDDTLLNEIFSLGGTPEELLKQKDLLEIFLPVIRADYEAIETYEYSERYYKFDFPITIFNGIYDKLTHTDIKEWENYTSSNFELYNFNGGHFFINDNIKEICRIIEKIALPLRI